jgi:hypothetical protein
MTTVPNANPATRTLEVYDSSTRTPAFVADLLALTRCRNLIGRLGSDNIKTANKRSYLGNTWPKVNMLLVQDGPTIVFPQARQSRSRERAPNIPSAPELVYTMLDPVVRQRPFQQGRREHSNGHKVGQGVAAIKDLACPPRTQDR